MSYKVSWENKNNYHQYITDNIKNEIDVETTLEKNNISKKVVLVWKIVPPEEGSGLCHRFVDHGREVCTARTTPHCERCCLNDICKKNGIKV